MNTLPSEGRTSQPYRGVAGNVGVNPRGVKTPEFGVGWSLHTGVLSITLQPLHSPFAYLVLKSEDIHIPAEDLPIY